MRNYYHQVKSYLMRPQCNPRRNYAFCRCVPVVTAPYISFVNHLIQLVFDLFILIAGSVIRRPFIKELFSLLSTYDKERVGTNQIE